MRSQSQITGVSKEIDKPHQAEVRDFHAGFRTWWKAHVKETRYWGGGPDGGFADSGKYGTASGAR